MRARVDTEVVVLDYTEYGFATVGPDGSAICGYIEADIREFRLTQARDPDFLRITAYQANAIVRHYSPKPWTSLTKIFGIPVQVVE